MKAITQTAYDFPGQVKRYEGKVRDVYFIKDKYLVMIATDRISAFDVVFPKGIPHKGQVLNTIASNFLDLTADIVPNWKIATPHPMVTVGYKCATFPVEFIVRGYLTGSSWRSYAAGERSLCGHPLPEGMREHQAFAKPLVTPTTKAEIGAHDENISKAQIIAQGLMTEEDYNQVEAYALALYQRGCEIAASRGLILVDTKYEFGKRGGEVCLIDEIHTPDSSRYFYKADYEENFPKGLKPKQLSKEFVREWLMANGFMGLSGQTMPPLTDEVVEGISARYIELYEHLVGEPFQKMAYGDDTYEAIERSVTGILSRL